MRNKREIGITLVALVITIIILLILSGIAIGQLTENGLFNNAKLAKEEYENKQKYENEVLSKYESMLNIDVLNSARESEFESTQIGEFSPTIKVNNGVYLEVTSNVTEKSSIPIGACIYLVNGKVGDAGTGDTGYIKNLNRNTKYTISIIAVDENGKFKKSNDLEVTTQNKVYLYNNGDQCIALTGGWVPSLNGGEANGTRVEPKLDFNNDNMQMHYDSISGDGQGSITTVNSIDYSQYNKLHITYTGTLGRYSSTATVRMINKVNQNYSEIKTLIYRQAVATKTTEEIDLSKINNIGDIYPYIKTIPYDGGTGSINIYEMWLE